MRHVRLLASVVVGLAATLAIVACSSSGGDPADNGAESVSEARSEKQRESAPVVSAQDKQALADGNAAFAFDLYKQVKGAGGNFIYSPFSTSIALAMTYAGARTVSEQQMASTLHFTLPQDKLHAAFNQVDLELQKRNQAANPATGKGFRISIANSLWGEKTEPFLSPFLDTLAVNYGAGMNLVDFKQNFDGARLLINDWVSNKTEGKIKDLLQPDDLNASTRLVLTNAIYFNASWDNPFKPENTTDGTFHTLDSGDVTVKMMQQHETMRYAEDADWQAVDVVYEGGLTGMTIVLPAQGKLDAVEAGLATSWLTQLDASATSTPVNLTLPKFSFTSRITLKPTLKALGMENPFSDAADFTGMVSGADDQLKIADVIHKAFIGVDEKGTEAAAATAVIMADAGAIPSQPKDVVLDRPFLFFIRDYPTGAILFSGRVVDPSLQ